MSYSLCHGRKVCRASPAPRLPGPPSTPPGKLPTTIPTGLGKTAAVVLSWLWNRVAQPDSAARSSWPRRLVYCLPMRTLVEQTAGEAEKWIRELADNKLIPGKSPKVIILMGGEETDPEDKNWDLHPEDDTIIIGTQDMLISRALNRGYGMSRYRWPMHFGLLNNDCRAFRSHTSAVRRILLLNFPLPGGVIPFPAPENVTTQGAVILVQAKHDLAGAGRR